MSRKLYIECNTGISGDMVVAALLDLGADRSRLEGVIKSLRDRIGGFDIRITEVEKSGIRACDFDVILEHDNHDHDMQYLYGHDQGGEHIGHHYSHEHEHNHSHKSDVEHSEHADSHESDGEHSEHAYSHEHYKHVASHEHGDGHHHTHEHRNLQDVVDIINAADMTDTARAMAIRIFTIVAEAESQVHGRPIEEVHFHEVGAIDSIVDIIAAAVCYDDINTSNKLDGTVITRLVDGTGTVRCQHGVLPVPVPAVLKIAEQTGVPLSIAARRGEYVTPTGAAFAAAVMTEDTLPESFRVIRTGLGAGKREHEVPGIVRAMIIES